MEEKDKLIRELSDKCSDRYGDVLLRFMDSYNLNNLGMATAEQLKAYIQKLDSENDDEKENAEQSKKARRKEKKLCKEQDRSR